MVKLSKTCLCVKDAISVLAIDVIFHGYTHAQDPKNNVQKNLTWSQYMKSCTLTPYLLNV